MTTTHEYFYNDTDCQMNSSLILCIEEHDSKHDVNSIDNRLFIGWDEKKGEYFVRGRRQETRTSDYVPYAFRCRFTDDLYDFIAFTVGTKGKNSITLYNYNNIATSSVDDITYEFLEQYMDRNYEIAGYDDVKLKARQVKDMLRLLKNLFNY